MSPRMGLIQARLLATKISPLQGFKASEMRHFGSNEDIKLEEPHPGRHFIYAGRL